MNEYVRLEEVTKIIEEQIRKRNCLEMGGTDRTVLNVLQVVKTRIWKLDIVEAEPARHGRWATDEEDIKWGNSLKRKHCTNCGKRPHFDKEKREFILTDYCPNCGAKMGGAEDG